MTLHAAMDYTPIDKYDTTEEQKWYAAFHAVGRVPNEDLPEILAMFGLIDIAPTPLPDDMTYCRRGHPHLPENIRPNPRQAAPSCRVCERNSRTGENR